MKNKVPPLTEDTLKDFTPNLLKLIGQAWGGRHWQADLARETRFTKSHLSRLSKAGRNITVRFGEAVDRVLVDKIQDVANFLGHDGSPNKADLRITKAKARIAEAIKLLREISPAEARTTIEETSHREHKPGRKPKIKKRRKA